MIQTLQNTEGRLFYVIRIKNRIGVSVLVRAHAEAPYLYEALQSITTQTTNCAIEVLIHLDRAAPLLFEQIDNFVRDYPELSLKVFESDSTGPAESLNFLIRQSNFDFLAILDSDDRMRPERIEKQLDFLLRNPEISIVGSAINIIDSAGHQIGQKGFLINPEDITDAKWKKLPVAQPSVLMLKSVIQSVGGYRQFYYPSEDYDLWLRVLEISKIANLSEILTDYRIHPLQVTSSRQFWNVSAGLAAKRSGKLRQRKKPEIQEKFKSNLHWAISTPYLLIVLQTAMRFSAWHKISLTKDFKRIFFAFAIIMISPINGPKELWRKIKIKKASWGNESLRFFDGRNRDK